MVAVLWRCRCARLCLGGGRGGVCGVAGVPGAARSVLWAGLRRGWRPARWAGLLGVAVGGGPPASRPRRELRSARRLEAWPGPAATSLISHVIPLWLIQTLNLHRWNCNVFGASRKMTAINYVRDLGTAVSSPPMGTAAWSSCPCGALRASGAWCAVMASPVSASHAVQSSPCVASCWRKRYKVRHACEKPAKKGHFGRAGRVLYRACGEKGAAGRILYREWGCACVQLPFFRHLRVPHPVPPGPPASSALRAVGVLQH